MVVGVLVMVVGTKQIVVEGQRQIVVVMIASDWSVGQCVVVAMVVEGQMLVA